jgi:PAS domain S-box-containing protein
VTHRPESKRTSSGLAAPAHPGGSDTEVQYDLLVNAVQDYAIFMLDAEGHVASWNPGAERIKGWRAEEIIGRHFSTFYLPDEVKSRKPQRELEIVREHGRYHEQGWRLRKDGSTFLAELIITPLIRDGQVKGFVKVTRDVTEREAANEAIRRLTEDLERRVEERTQQLIQVNEELEAFAYTVAHDLRAPLRAMQGFSDALREDYGGQLDETGREYLSRIAAGAERLDQLIRDLLAYSRLSRENLTLEPVALDWIFCQAVEQVNSSSRAGEATLNIQPNLPIVRAHAATLQQVVANLLSNAMKFMPAGRQPKIQVWSEPREAFARVFVRDNGIGIAAEHFPRIFEVFQRLHGVTEYGGTGIGLAIVKKGVERMGGSVGVASEPGVGSTFWFELERA